MIFDFLKRFFGLVDEGSRKRRADDDDDDDDDECTPSIVASPKKHRRDPEGTRLDRVIYANENDEDEIQFVGDLHCSPMRSKERLNGTSCTRRKIGSTYQQPVQSYRKNSHSRINEKEKITSSFSIKSIAAMSTRHSKSSTLTKTNQLREKQEYGQLLQRFLPQKCHIIRGKIENDESKRRQVAEVIDLEKYETPIKSLSDSVGKTRRVLSTPSASTPLRYYTPRETSNREPFAFGYRNDDDDDDDKKASVLSTRRTLNAKTDEISILKGKTSSEKILTSIVPTVRVNLPEDGSTSPLSRKGPKIGISVTKTIPTIRIDLTQNASIIPSPIKSTVDKNEPSTSIIPSPIKSTVDKNETPTSINYVEVIQTNTLRDNLASKAVVKRDFVPRVSDHYKERFEQRMKDAEDLKRMACLLSKRNRVAREAALETQLARSMRLCEAVLDETEELEEPTLPEITTVMIQDIKRALVPNPPNEVLVESFGLRITRKDIYTLSGLNWLNDEVINFYMNLLIVRGTSNDKYPKVHAMNTFFYPKLLSGGHASLKRWTRKIDVFAQDILVVPIHLGIHWCMSIVDFRDKTIRYFDSMGGSSPKCLVTLRKYLEDESIDKRKKSFETNDWKLISMRDIPQQMNGSDCGVFSCMFAEFITANRKITFTQQDMPYFRNKMVYEIIKAKLL